MRILIIAVILLFAAPAYADKKEVCEDVCREMLHRCLGMCDTDDCMDACFAMDTIRCVKKCVGD